MSNGENQKARNSTHWLKSFVESTAPSGSPEIWRRWCAFASVSCAIRRRLRYFAWGNYLYPNLYILLVGPPGFGKSTAIRDARFILRQLPQITLAPSMITKEKLIEIFAQSGETILYPSDTHPRIVNSVAMLCDEFGVFVRPSDAELTTILTDLYDANDKAIFTYATRGRAEQDVVESSYATLLGGTTPKAIAESSGIKMLGTGFFARFIIAYAEQRKAMSPFKRGPQVDLSPLVEDIQQISSLIGDYAFTPAAQKVYDDWYFSGMSPAPTDARLAEYVGRRPSHLLKLCMIFAVSKRNDLIVEEEDVIEARQLMLETEVEMRLAVEKAGQDKNSEAIDYVHDWACKQFLMTSSPIRESYLRAQLIQHVPPFQLSLIVDSMISTGMLRQVGGQGAARLFVPQVRDRESGEYKSQNEGKN